MRQSSRQVGSILALAAAFFASAALADSCSDTCWKAGLSASSCRAADTNCLCSDDNFYNTFTDCVPRCTGKDSETIYWNAVNICMDSNLPDGLLEKPPYELQSTLTTPSSTREDPTTTGTATSEDDSKTTTTKPSTTTEDNETTTGIPSRTDDNESLKPTNDDPEDNVADDKDRPSNDPPTSALSNGAKIGIGVGAGVGGVAVVLGIIGLLMFFRRRNKRAQQDAFGSGGTVPSNGSSPPSKPAMAGPILPGPTAQMPAAPSRKAAVAAAGATGAAAAGTGAGGELGRSGSFFNNGAHRSFDQPADNTYFRDMGPSTTAGAGAQTYYPPPAAAAGVGGRGPVEATNPYPSGVLSELPGSISQPPTPQPGLVANRASATGLGLPAVLIPGPTAPAFPALGLAAANQAATGTGTGTLSVSSGSATTQQYGSSVAGAGPYHKGGMMGAGQNVGPAQGAFEMP